MLRKHFLGAVPVMDAATEVAIQPDPIDIGGHITHVPTPYLVWTCSPKLRHRPWLLR